MSPVLTSLLCRASIPELPPSVNHIWVQGKGRTYKPKAVLVWQETARLLLAHGKTISEPYTGKVALFITLYVKNNRRMDIDNRIKCLQDCLEPAGLLKDDSQVWLLEVGRVQDNEGKEERVEMEIWAIRDPSLFMDALRQRWFSGACGVDIIHVDPTEIERPKRKAKVKEPVIIRTVKTSKRRG